jgi:hypothetical protein
VKNSSNRFAHLLAKGKAGQLTDQEKRELAHLINEPILPSPQDSSLKFVSKYLMTETDLATRLEAIDWFSKCGETFHFDLTMKVEQVKTWPQATKILQSQSWEDATLEARNQLTEFLADHHPERFDQWNNITEQFKDELITPLTKKVWLPYQRAHQLDIKLVHNVQWNILAALMENAYLDCNHQSFFFLELLRVYEAGHMPCGWLGNWPNGKLVIF